MLLSTIRLFDIVALTEDLPHNGFFRGPVRRVVELLAAHVFEVEFMTTKGEPMPGSPSGPIIIAFAPSTC